MIWVGRLISLAVLQQTIEFFWIKPYAWKIVRAEIPRLFWPFLFSYRGLLILQGGAALVSLVCPSAVSIGLMLFTAWALAVRWRGTFNGGSDFMTFQILAALFVRLIHPSWENYAAIYIAIQLVLSYFVAGLVKILNSEWRRGEAPRLFLKRRGFSISSQASRAASLVVIGFELISPIGFFAPVPFLTSAVLFHLMNAYLFGLNRFFFVWIAAFPALLTLSF